MRKFLIICLIVVIKASPQYNYKEPNSQVNPLQSALFQQGLTPKQNLSATHSKEDQGFVKIDDSNKLDGIQKEVNISKHNGLSSLHQNGTNGSDQMGIDSSSLEKNSQQNRFIGSLQNRFAGFQQTGNVQQKFIKPSVDIPRQQGFNRSSEPLVMAKNIRNTTINQFRPKRPSIISKHFYIHSAGDDNDDESEINELDLGQQQKHYQIIFIKTPTSDIKIHPAPIEEKTIIYVLTKKPDISVVQTDFKDEPIKPNKPEVIFIMYKTNEEAIHVQNKIQAEYDSLEGSSQISDEGIAPTASIIDSFDNENNDDLDSRSSSEQEDTGGSSKPYLSSN